MSTVSVLPEVNGTKGQLYRAISGEREAVGLTVGDAVNAVTVPPGNPAETTMIIVQPMQPDRFFSADQIHRMKELMAKWRAALNIGASLPSDEQTELDELVRVEFEGMIERTRALVGDTAT